MIVDCGPYTSGPVDCPKCSLHDVWYYEIDEVYQDYRWKCFACGAHGVWEGPDA